MTTILIVGTGSVGKRHAKNFAELGYKISCVDPRKDRVSELSGEIKVEYTYETLNSALDGGETYSGLVICSPPKFHVDQTCASLDRGIPVLLEKPVSKTLGETGILKNALSNSEIRGGPHLLLGYTWRWSPELIYLKQLIDSSILGRLYFCRIHVSAHLADWHPWEDYREYFMSSKELGGGALLDESHWIDQMIWFFGLPDQIVGRVSKISDLELSCDDSVDALGIFKNGLNLSIHLDIYGRPHEKTIQLIGEKGSITWNEEDKTVSCYLSGQEDTFTVFDEDRNFMFCKVAEEFVDVMNGNKPSTCTLSDGCNVLKVIEAIRLSNESGEFIQLSKM